MDYRQSHTHIKNGSEPTLRRGHDKTIEVQLSCLVLPVILDVHDPDDMGGVVRVRGKICSRPDDLGCLHVKVTFLCSVYPCYDGIVPNKEVLV